MTRALLAIIQCQLGFVIAVGHSGIRRACDHLKLLVDLGRACEQFHDEHVRNVRVRRLQCDEIWCFVGAKAKNVTPEQKEQGWGDTWTWTGLDANSKLCVSYLVGGRSADWAMEFMLDCAARIKGKVQITTDGHQHIWKQ